MHTRSKWELLSESTAALTFNDRSAVPDGGECPTILSPSSFCTPSGRACDPSDCLQSRPKQREWMPSRGSRGRKGGPTFPRQVSLGVEQEGGGEGRFQERRRGAVVKGWARGAWHWPGRRPPPTVKVNPRTGGTCGGLAQPKGTGRSWESREATVAAGALSSGLGVGVAGRREAVRWPSAGGYRGGGCQLGLNPPTCGSPTLAPTSAPPRPRPGPAPAPPRPRPMRLAPPPGRIWRDSGREPGAARSGLRGGGGLGAGEVWATSGGGAALPSQAEARRTRGRRTPLRTPSGRCHRFASSSLVRGCCLGRVRLPPPLSGPARLTRSKRCWG